MHFITILFPRHMLLKKQEKAKPVIFKLYKVKCIAKPIIIKKF
jgi:hypothetical protein